MVARGPWPGGAPSRCVWLPEWQSWSCSGRPPDPWPARPPNDEYDPAVFGPPGTSWWYDDGDLHQLEDSGVGAALHTLLSKLRPLPAPQGGGGYLWTVPDPLAPPATPVEAHMMRWVRTQIIAKLGTAEEVVHVHNWRHKTIENADIDALGLKILGNTVRNCWTEFMTAGGIVMPSELAYTEVRTAVMEQDAPGQKPRWPGSTQISPFASSVIGAGGATTLPYEVAMAVSLNTNFRGTSRFRGRTYLGPLIASVLGANGLFVSTTANAVGGAFWTKFVTQVAAGSDYELHIVSQKYGTSAQVTGLRMGVVPDSQRRRRRDQVENYVQVGGDPVGAH